LKAGQFHNDPFLNTAGTMVVPHKRYAVWQARCDAFHEIISEENAGWVLGLVSFTNEIESECPDSDVVGYARSARRQALAFSNTRSADRSYMFNGFLASLLRLSIALGIHLIGYHGIRKFDEALVQGQPDQDRALDDPTRST
jgi:hypothetical protein